MAQFQSTASAKAALLNNPGDVLTSQGFQLALRRGLDKVWKREFEALQQGSQFFVEKTMRQEYANMNSYRQIGGLVPQNRDTEDIPFATTGDGFSFSVVSYNYRRGIQIEKTLMEVDDVGVAKNRQAELARSAKLTLEHAMADVFNRGVDDGTMSTGAPILCDDGMYLCDSGRPNANPDASSWSNLEASSAITPDSIFQAQLNARATRSDDGELYPLSIKAIVCRPQDSKNLWEIRNSNYRPTDAFNVNNYFKDNKDATFDVVVYDYLTSANIFYWLDSPKSDNNELYLYWRVRPEFATWVNGDNPDVTSQRVRFAFGLGAGSPRKSLRGGRVS